MATDRDARVQEVLSLPPTTEFPRNSEGDIIALKDGRLLLVYSRFTGGHEDGASADLVARHSGDQGLTWGEDELLLPREGAMNSMSVSLLRLSDGALAIFYLVKQSLTDCRPYLRTSQDEGRTWSDPTLVIAEPGYFVVNNARVLQLPSGRIVIPASWHRIPPTGGPFTPGLATSFHSDDLGRTWQRSETTLHAPEGCASGLQEPGLIRLSSGALLMVIRIDLGCQYQSLSLDEGETWSLPVPGPLVSPLSPATLRRLPETGELLAIWNDHAHLPAELRGKRTPLVTAISRDEGATWEHHKVLEDDPEGWYCYTACTFVGDHTLLAYCAGGRGLFGLSRLRVTRIRTDWFRD